MKRHAIPDRFYYWALVLPGILFTFLFNTRTWPGIVAMVPILCVYPFIQKYFTTGMTLGAVKG